MSRQLAYLGASARALAELRRSVEQGFYCSQTLSRDPWLDSLRGSPELTAIVELAEQGRRGAAAAFLEEGGETLLGVRSA